MKVRLVIAGSNSQYKQWLRLNGLSKDNYKYVHDVRDTMGIDHPIVHIVGTGTGRSDYYDLIEALRGRHAEFKVATNNHKMGGY